ncbi:hypothetical protein N9Y04_05835 [Porticoccaceae bacterium]|nr:hypothetical protein [Porticoccaceae bacterium]MDB2566647.1 hypothetical protein [Porticoccaceae bacterium]MDB2621440.1 hypothetical protein [Porticoccaceae bacterium]MDC0523950.1 hypothetical protein [Porticoccaceae bacterium]
MNIHSQEEIREISQEFIETYLDVVLHQCFAYEAEKYCKITEDELPAFKRDKVLSLVDKLAELEKEPFERYVKANHSGALHDIHNLLKKVHSVTVNLNPDYFYLGVDEISDERQFDLAIIRVIAGATVVTLDPEWFSHEGPAAGALDWVEPSDKLQKKMRTALEVAQEEGTKLPILFEKQLGLLARGIPIIGQHEPTEKLLQLMVREITLISNQLFTISNSGKNRFPAKAIVAIGEILNLKLPTERTISKMQEKIETEVDPNESPLSDNINNIPP